MSDTTIAAIATPFGNGGIGIIRISGPDAFRIGKTVFRKGRQQQASEPVTKTRALQYGYIVDEANGERLDEVLVAFMSGPRTYTREDTVEIHAHSGRFVLRSILALVLMHGAEIAQPGEFTKRAFLNGRIDLTQAEAVADVITAGSKAALRIATSKLSGGLKEKIENARAGLLDIHARLEARIDFPEETRFADDGQLDIDTLKTTLIQPIQAIVSGFERASYLVEGLQLVIVGEPNVGKSSLMNRILNKDKAIVTPEPGTTRDLVEEHIHIKGLPVIVSDTAGLHATDDPVEQLGIQKAEERIETADIVILVLEACRDISENEKALYEKIKEKEMVIAINKQDLIDGDGAFRLPDAWLERKSVRVSALKGFGVERLVEIIESSCLSDSGGVGDEIVPNLRQKRLLERCLASAENALKSLGREDRAEIAAIDVADAIGALDELLGEKADADVLDRLFEHFCIGK